MEKKVYIQRGSDRWRDSREDRRKKEGERERAL